MTGQPPPPKSASQQRLDELVTLNSKLVEQNDELLKLATPKRGKFDGLKLIAFIIGFIVVGLVCHHTFTFGDQGQSAIQQTQLMTEAIVGLILGFGLISLGKK